VGIALRSLRYLALVAAAYLVTGYGAVLASTPKRVLIIQSFGRESAPYSPAASAFRTELEKRSETRVVFLEANLDAGRPVTPDEERPILEYLRSRFAASPPDLVVTIGPPAARLYLAHRDELFADRHQELSEGVRELLGTMFAAVFTVADEASLMEGAARIQPTLVVADIALASGDIDGFRTALRRHAPAAKVLVITAHDEATVADASHAAGVEGVVLMRSIATDLLPAVDAVLAGKEYTSSAMAR
jgi:CheY-like chemotaxis protein